MLNNGSDFNCKACKWGKHCDADGLIEGSVGKAPFPKWEIAGVINSDICLLPMINECSALMIRLYSHYKNGLLPYGGGIFEQPNKFMRSMEIIERTVGVK